MIKVKMPMTETPFNKITHSTRWQHWAFLVIIQVGILLCAGTYWSIQRVVDQEQRRFKTDFLSLIDYVKEQEQFLYQLKIRSQQLTAPLPPIKTSDVYEIESPSGSAIRMFEGQSLPIKLPFTLACQTLSECNMMKNSLFSLGSYFSDFYASFWSASYYPAAPIFFVNDTNKLSLSVPAVNAQSVYEHISVKNYQDIINYLLRNLQKRADKSCKLPAKNDNVVWLRIADQPAQLAGVIPIDLSPERDHNLSLSQGCLYMAAVVTPSVIRALEHRLNPAPEYRFWLQNREHSWLYNKKHGYLIGEAQAPENSHDGMNFTLSGLVFRFTDNTDSWVGIYRIPYSSFFLDHLGLFSATLLLLTLSLLSCFYYMYWYNRYVLVPAKEAQRDILESDTFNRTLIQTAPIALCLISRQNGQVVFANQLALDWLDTEVGQPLPDSPAMKSLLDTVQSASHEGRIEQLEITADKTLYVVYTPTRYQQQSVTLCAFTDVSFHAEIERTLIEMRQAADEANKAKSTFLATMSHEIRTPLYGVIGTLELLSLTNQDDQQRQYVRRMEDSSQMLLRIISDILDISKIEARQLQLDLSAFNLGALVESTVSAYAGMANNKGLLLFSVIATDIPSTVLGDPTRLRQILSNLISNAIKFTHSGYVIIRVSALNALNDTPHLLFEVCDSGIGIDPIQQAKLFTPFYIVEHERHSAGGAGLGLSICASLAELMNTKIQLTSEPLMGSIFFFELTLERADGPPLPAPDLQGATLYIRTPHPELTVSVSQWLGRWGANTISWHDGEHSPEREAILLDITQSADNRITDWPGKYIGLSLSGEEGNGEIDTYSMTSIGFGIDRLIHNIAEAAPSIALLPRFDLRVLLAEDNPINQVTLQEQLELLGCQVMLACDGEEALALWDISPYDIVLTDVNMPYLNGYELSRQLRAEGVMQPIIGVTANAMRDEEQRCLEAGMNAWLVKPIDIRQLATLLSQYVAAEHIVDRLQTEPTSGPSADILKKHKQLFLQTMWQDWHQLDEGIRQSDVDEIEMTLHRMRGALVLVDQHALSSQIALLEENLQASGLNEVALEQIVFMAKTLHQLLTEIETESLSGTRS